MTTSPDKLNQGRQTLMLATQPDRNATIRASAGTGKTYLLVSRLVRLLLAGVEPAGLLAITFTRKAAAEMQQRLQQRLREWLQADTPALEHMLDELGVEKGPEQIARARHQFERLLRNDRRPRITTFHAFCQDILRRFPVEADIPPGFVLLEDTGIMAEQAWDGLWHDATRAPDTDVARALQSLLQNCGGIESCRRALFNFLHHRSDWWAFTDQAEARLAVTWASDHLREQLHLADTDRSIADFYTVDRTALLQTYGDLLAAHDTAANRKLAALISDIIATCHHAVDPPPLEQLAPVFYTTAGESRKVNETRARAQAIGEAGQQRFLELHARLKEAYDEAIELQRRLHTWQLSTAWYQAGQRLLDHFQQLKQQQRLLDFTDLEWRACRLLNDGQHSHWIQYKLDRRISHILVDEFQDTNPTQWRLLLPLLEELAASGGHGKDGEQRSVFLVGDEKQSIYRFRRADPRLFSAAGLWLEQHTGAVEYPLSVSWRSSPAIIDAVNRVFTQEQFSRLMPGFTAHDTHRRQLSGRVELLPLITMPVDSGSKDDVEPDFRNPLYSPRLSATREQHRDEGRQISRHIQSLRDETPHLAYSDILVLIRHRTHQHDYEQAFRKAGIPYVGSGRKTLLDTLEIQDIVALLQTLTSPGNNHALAQTLRSPLFACTDHDLVLLASHCRQTSQDWYEALLAMAEADTLTEPALQRAARWLPHWRKLAHQLPVHDLLDRIFAEGNVEERFGGAFPEHLQRRVRANLTRLVELALEIDSGRYPSLPAFLNKLQRLHQHAPENLQQTALADDESDNAVRIMTVHAAKGLEAPVVYLVDSGYKRPQARAWQTLVDWPSDASRPDSFLLTGRSRSLDGWSRQRLETEARADAREDANLLYVALTRAQRFLFISGCAHKGAQQGWYQIIARAFGCSDSEETQVLSQHDATSDDKDRKSDNAVIIPRQEQEPPVPLALSRPLSPATSTAWLRPSDNSPEKPDMGDSSARDRGTLIHRLLELCTGTPPLALNEAVERTAHESHISVTDPAFRLCVEEIDKLLSQADLHAFFHPGPDARVYNEVPLLYEDQGRQVHGIIDRLIVDAQRVTLIDYKTRDHADVSDSELSAPYRRQLQMYIEGLRRLWPARYIHAVLIFTRSGRQVDIDG